MKKLLEREIQYGILEYLKFKNIVAWKQNTAGIRKPDGSYIPSHTRGVSDILGILPNGRFLAIEVKQEGKYPTPEQKEFLGKIERNGGLALVARSIDDVMGAGL